MEREISPHKKSHSVFCILKELDADTPLHTSSTKSILILQFLLILSSSSCLFPLGFRTKMLYGSNCKEKIYRHIPYSPPWRGAKQ
jgi:hypothetical protein